MKQVANILTVLFVYSITIVFVSAAEPANDDRYLYIKDIETTIRGEKAGNFCSPMDKICKSLSERTEKKWWRSNGSFSLLFGSQGITKPSSGIIGMYPVRKSVVPLGFPVAPSFSKRGRVFSINDPYHVDKNWYIITISDGVLIQGNTEAGLTNAAEHFIALLEGTDNDLRLPKGVYTPTSRPAVPHDKSSLRSATVDKNSSGLKLK
jgi:hypothetical protein